MPTVDFSIFYGHWFFQAFSAMSICLTLLMFISALVLYARGLLPVLYRLGKSLATRRVAILAEPAVFSDIQQLMLDTHLFREKNIQSLSKNSLKKMGEYSLVVIHYSHAKHYIDKVIQQKRDPQTLIVYAPQNEGKIDDPIMQQLNQERYTVVVNMRGRLISDIFVGLITTKF